MERIAELAVPLGGIQRSKPHAIRRSKPKPFHHQRREFWHLHGVIDQSADDAVRLAVRVLRRLALSKTAGERKLPGGFILPRGQWLQMLAIARKLLGSMQ